MQPSLSPAPTPSTSTLGRLCQPLSALRRREARAFSHPYFLPSPPESRYVPAADASFDAEGRTKLGESSLPTHSARRANAHTSAAAADVACSPSAPTRRAAGSNARIPQQRITAVLPVLTRVRRPCSTIPTAGAGVATTREAPPALFAGVAVLAQQCIKSRHLPSIPPPAGRLTSHVAPADNCRGLLQKTYLHRWRGTLHGSRCEYDLAELLGDKTVQERTAEIVLDFFPDLCSVTPVILTEVVSAMVCNVALNAYGKALDLHVGEIHDKEPADNVEAGVGSLDAASPSEARAFIVELLEPLVGAAVTAAARHHERKFSATGEPTTVPTFTIIEERVPSASPIQEYDPSTPCGPSEHGTAGSASDNERETPSFSDATRG
ncbi:hypothetical protein K525DRAFT_275329 [Schizophyllum commune Loenen D]|nr:hypothetical protein K525DRAFT_275329 [Schizophyllum commune Loenen D]